MATLLSLLYSVKNSKIDTLTIDATLSENHSLTSELTDHPVEEGSDITDHRRDKPDVIKIEGVISNTPLNRQQSISGYARSFVPLANTALGVADLIGGRPGHAENAFAVLRELKESGKLITVTTGIRTYENMILTELSIPRDAKTGDAFQFTATLRSVRLVRNKLVRLVNAAIPKVNPPKKTGTKAPAKPDARSKTILKKLADTDAGNTFLHTIGWR